MISAAAHRVRVFDTQVDAIPFVVHTRLRESGDVLIPRPFWSIRRQQ